MNRYEHIQQGTLVQAALFIGAAACLALSLIAPTPPFVAPMVVAIAAVCAYLFSSLTIQVAERALRWHFGPGLFRKEIALTEIQGVEVTRTRWIEGWGIHRTSRGWLYNVSGFGAVLVRLQSGRSILLGSDEPDRLRAAILRGINRAG
jgi:hypothetical protein